MRRLAVADRRGLELLVRRPSRVVARREGEVSCEWCSCDGTRFVRFAGAGPETSADVVDFCDECARALRDAITRRLRRVGQ